MADREFKGVWIPKEIWLCKDLTALDRVIYAEIDSLDNENHCTASNKYFAEFCGVGEATITRSIQKLIDKGYIEVVSFDGRRRVIKMIKQTHQNDEAESSKCVANNIDNKQTNNISISKDIDIEWFMQNYHEICISFPKVKSLTDKRKKAIKKILKSYSKEDILDVFEKAESSDFLKGNNDRGWKANIDFMLREDKFVNILEGQYGGRKKTKSAMHDIEGLNRVASRARKGDDDDGTKF